MRVSPTPRNAEVPTNSSAAGPNVIAAIERNVTPSGSTSGPAPRSCIAGVAKSSPIMVARRPMARPTINDWRNTRLALSMSPAPLARAIKAVLPTLTAMKSTVASQTIWLARPTPASADALV